MPPVKPYRSIPIRECGEAMAPIPAGLCLHADPHPYKALGAPYGAESPWMLRHSLIDALKNAQGALQKTRPGWKIMLYDAYRPLAVYRFMVNREFVLQARAAGIDPNPDRQTAAQREALEAAVYRLWAIPEDDPASPPPHSTGAAFDCTLADEGGREVDMGSPVDENSDRSNPDYFAHQHTEAAQRAHAHRQLLNDILSAEGFRRHQAEWWHFSRGDQLAVWAARGEADCPPFAIYGRADLVEKG